MRLWFQRGAWASRRGRERARALRPEDVSTIAVIRHAALGDMVITRPFLVECRRHFPGAAITLSLVTKYTLGAPDDLVDRVHVAYGSDRRDVALGEQLRRARELGHHDIVFDLAATPRSFYLCLLNPARLKIGFPYHSLQRHIYDLTVLRSDFRFEAEVLLDMLHILGARTEFPLDYALDVEPRSSDTPYIVYFTTASTRSKCWPRDSYVELIRRLAARHRDHQHLVLEGLDGWESIGAIIEALSDVANVTGTASLPLDQTTALLRGARLVVSNDTGIRNLAIAAGTPTLGVFLESVPFRYWPRDGRHEAVFRMDGGTPSVDEVLEATTRHLSAVAGPGGG